MRFFLSEYFAHDLVTFLYDYISELLDLDNLLYASELIEEFAPYMPDPLRFHCLEARILSATNIVEANQRIKTLLDQPLTPDLPLDLLRLLAAIGEHNLFQTAVKKILPAIEEKEDIEELMDLAVEYYRRLDLDQLEEAVVRIQKQTPLDLKAFQKIIFSNNI